VFPNFLPNLPIEDLIPFLDVTNLNPEATEAEISTLCHHINKLSESVAAICVYPNMLPLVKKLIRQPIGFCTVVNFPFGHFPKLEVRSQIFEALDLGATEIDLVIPYHDFQLNSNKLEDFLIPCRELIPRGKILKAILETGALSDEEIALATDLCLKARCDFIKTSTGKHTGHLTHQAVRIMATQIKNYYVSTGIKAGIKIAGGIDNIKIANEYLGIILQVLSPEWLNSRYFRIGATKLFNQILIKYNH
jgi:deoxyribose-phosphate aldolase